jgi:hypothetical protein
VDLVDWGGGEANWIKMADSRVQWRINVNACFFSPSPSLSLTSLYRASVSGRRASDLFSTDALL